MANIETNDTKSTSDDLYITLINYNTDLYMDYNIKEYKGVGDCTCIGDYHDDTRIDDGRCPKCGRHRK